ncbi:MAG: tetratricopeptide repeat protein, partial [Planctomycetota bacterium]
ALAKNLGEDARAVEAYEELLVKRKDQAERYRTEILSIFLRSSDAEGLAAFLQGQPATADVYLDLVRLYQGRGSFAEAAKAYEEALRLDPRLLERHRIPYFEVLLQAGRRPAAVGLVRETLDDCLRKAPGGWDQRLDRWRPLLQSMIGGLSAEERESVLAHLRDQKGSAAADAWSLLWALACEAAGRYADAGDAYVQAGMQAITDIYFQKGILASLKRMGACSAAAPLVERYLSVEGSPPLRKNFCRTVIACLGSERLPAETWSKVEGVLMSPLGGSVALSDQEAVARYYEGVGEDAQAVRVLDGALRQALEGSQREAPAILQAAVRLALRRGDRHKARELVILFLEQGPKQAGVDYGARKDALLKALGRDASDAGELDGVLTAAITNMLGRKDLSDSRKLDLAILAGNLGMFPEEVSLLEKVAPQGPGDAALQLAYLRALTRTGDLDRARAVGDALLDVPLGMGEELVSELSQLYLKVGDSLALKRVLERQARREMSPETWRSLSAAELTAGLTAEGIDAFRKYVLVAKSAGSQRGWDPDTELAALLRSNGLAQQALEVIERAVAEVEQQEALFPESVYEEEIACYRAAGRMSDLVERLERASLAHPSDWRPIEVLARIYAGEKNYEALIETRRRLCALDPSNGQFAVKLASALALAERHGEAAEVYLSLASGAGSPVSERYLLMGARSFLAGGLLDEGRHAVSSALENARTQSPRMLLQISAEASQVLREAGEKEMRLRVLEEAWKTSLERPVTVAVEYLEALLAAGRATDAVSVLTEALTSARREDQYRDLLQPFLSGSPAGEEAMKGVRAFLLGGAFPDEHRGEAVSILGTVAQELVRRGERERAEDLLRCALKAVGEDGRLLVLLAEVLRGQGKASEAARYLERAVEQHADDEEETLLELGLCYMEAGDAASGMRALERAYGLRKDPSVFLAAARRQARSGGVEGALAPYGRCRELLPDDVGCLNELFDLLLAGGEKAKALSLLRGVRDATGSAAMLSAAASGFRRLGAQNEVEDALRKVIEMDPMNVSALEELAGLLEKDGRHESALEVLERLAGVPGLSQEQARRVTRDWLRICLETGSLDPMIAEVSDSLTNDAKALSARALKLAEALEGAGKLARALRYYSQALALGGVDAPAIEEEVRQLEQRLERGDI